MKLPLTGTSRPPRYGAAVIDNTLAMFAALATGGVVGDQFRVLISKDLVGPLGLTLLPFVFLSYFFFFEWLFNATPGKIFVGLTVRQLDGSSCGAKAAFFRTATRLIELNPFVLGCIPAAFIIWRSEKNQRWGDMLANTVVVPRRSVK